ncbi:MAG TPA: hypothetical protein VE175_02260 [Woeseiaceae bacterium]|nr:hypothetical protein [Woeseiaceae bacterium]
MNAGTEGIRPDAPPGQSDANTKARSRSAEPRAAEQAAKVAHGAVDRATETAARAEERVREATAAGEQRLREKGEEARVIADRALDHMREYTKENPFAAAGIAFAAGVLLSRLMSR